MSETIQDALSFLPGVGDKLGCYVYALRDPRDSKIFYVGKGKGDRCHAHARQAAADSNEPIENQKLELIRAIQATGAAVNVEIIRHGLRDDQEAFEVEAAVIDALVLADCRLANIVRGHRTERGLRPLDDVIASYAARPATILPDHRVVLIRINREFYYGISDDELYDKTRQWWVIGRSRQPQWAFSVYRGIVRAVYRIDQWEQGLGGLKRRRSFTGARDPDMESRYYWGDVSSYFRPGQQSPLVYVNC